MSSEPTDDELTAAEVRYWHGENTGIKDALTAANSIRDRRIRNDALEEAAAVCERYRRPDGSRSGLALSLADIICALKDKTDE